MHYLTNLWNALDFGSLGSILLRLCAVFLCLTIHETCHGLAAYALGDPTANARPPAEPEPPAAHRLAGSYHDGGGRLRLGEARAGGSPLFQKAQAGHGHHRAGRTRIQFPAGAGAAADRAGCLSPGAGHRAAQRDVVFVPAEHGVPVRGSGAFQSDAHPAAGRLQGAGGAAAGQGIQLADAL